MSEELRPFARRIYFTSRKMQATHWKSLSAVRPLLQHHLNKQQNDVEHGVQGTVLPTLPTPQQVDEWAIEEAWDLQYQQLQQDEFRDNLRSPEDQEDRFRLRLETQQRSLEIAAEALKLVQDEMDLPDFVVSDAYLQKLDRSQRVYKSAHLELERVENDARKRLLEAQAGPVAEVQIKALKERLLDEYGGRGPQYELLCEMLADLSYQRQQSRGSGRDVSIQEMVALNQAVINTIGQLQKYTESTKSESLSKDRNELGAALMAVIESLVRPSQPQLWTKILSEVKHRLTAPEPFDRPLLRILPSASETVVDSGS